MNRTAQEQIHKGILDRIEEVPAASAVVLEIIRRTSDEACNFKEVAGLLSKDAGLASKVMRVANSAYFGMPRRVETLTAAVPLIGMRALRRMVMTISTYDLLDVQLNGYGLEKGGLWAHSLAVSKAISFICGLTGFKQEEELRVAALFHDVGKIVLSPFLANASDPEIATIMLGGGVPAVDLEIELCGIDHAEISAVIGEKWNLSDRFVEVLRYHHWPEIIPNVPKAVSVINVADSITRTLLGNEGPDSSTLDLDPVSVMALELDEAALKERTIPLYADMLQELAYWTAG